MKQVIYLTHKGWFGICPVYCAFLDEETPFLEPRWWWASWLLPVSEAAYRFCFHVMSAMDPEFEPLFVIEVTGKLDTPISVEADDGEDA